MQFPRVLFRLLTLALFLAPLGAMAQIGGLYADFSTTALSTSGSPQFYGATFGGYDEVNLKNTFKFLRIGGDARFSIEHAGSPNAPPNTGFGSNPSGNSYTYDTFVIGPEVSFKTHLTRLRPYAEVLFGGAYVSGDLVSGGFTGYVPGVNDTVSQNYGLVSFVGGADVTLLPHLAWRVLEVNVGEFSGTASTTFSTGVVLRMP